MATRIATAPLLAYVQFGTGKFASYTGPFRTAEAAQAYLGTQVREYLPCEVKVVRRRRVPRVCDLPNVPGHLTNAEVDALPEIVFARSVLGD